MTDNGRANTAVTFSEADGAPVIGLAGELDLASVDAVGEAIEATVARARGRLVFDLGGLRFMDSSGIALLLNVAQRVGDMRVKEPIPLVRQVIDLMGLSDILQVDP
jgi:anti-sigma B factor antagonist